MSDSSFPHLRSIRRSITALYRTLGRDRVGRTTTLDQAVATSFTNWPSVAVLAPDQIDRLRTQTAHLGQTIITLLGLPDARITLGYGRLVGRAAEVELSPAGYRITISSDCEPRDYPGVLGHEMTHVFLARHSLGFPETAENEILTDTASVYLGPGWSIIESHRVEEARDLTGGRYRITSAIGYLTQPEYGYVLSKRCHEISMSDPLDLVTGTEARAAVRRGDALARLDRSTPPLASAAWQEREHLRRELRRYDAGPTPSKRTPYLRYRETGRFRFERGADGRPRIVLACPRCFQRLRIPVASQAHVRCPCCREVFDCAI